MPMFDDALARGNALLEDKCYEDALAAFDEAIRINPKNAHPWHGRGMALSQLGRFSGALAAFEQAINIDKTNASSWNSKGIVLNQLGRLDQAIGAFGQAIGINPNFALPWHGKGDALHTKGRLDEALEAYERAIDLDGKHAVPWNSKGVALNEQGRFIEALAAYERSINLDEAYALPWHGKGNMLYKLGRLDEAEEARLRAAHLARQYPSFEHRQVLPALMRFWLWRGGRPLLCAHLAAELGVRDASLHALPGLSVAEDAAFGYGLALLHARQSSGLSLTHGQVLRALGLMAFSLGDPFEALHHFDVLDTEDDTDLLGQYYYAQCYDAYLDTEHADAVLGVALEQAERVRLAPDDHEPERLYYAGRLFWQREGLEVKALQCARASADRGFLSARYLEARIARRLGQDQMEDRIYRDIAAAELALHEAGTPALGFLVPYQMPPLNLENTAWVDEVVHAAHVAEVEEDVQQLYQWLEDQRGTAHDLTRQGRASEAAAVYEPAWDSLDDFRMDVADAYATRQQIAVAEESIAQVAALVSEWAEEDIEALEQTVRARFPELYRNDGRYTPEDLENVIGERIREKSSREFTWEPYRDLALVLAARERLAPESVLRLTVFARLKAPDLSAEQSVADEMARGVLSSVLGPGSASAVIVAAVLTPTLGPLASVAVAATSGVLAEIGVQLARRLRQQSVAYAFYSDYRADFEWHLFDMMQGADRERLDRLLYLRNNGDF